MGEGSPLPVIAPGATIGILGSGQLGRMLALAAARFGLTSHIYAPEPGPAFDVAARHTLAGYDDLAALAQFGAQVSVVTYEFENVPAEAAAAIGAHCAVLPGPRALAITQDRLSEKQFVNSLGISTAPFAPVDDAGSLARAVAQIGRPAILKTRRFGYDGKGQTMIRDGSDLSAVFRSLGGAPCILEGVVPFTREISVVAARSADGSFAAFDVCENEHSHHILSLTLVPAAITPETSAQAIAMAQKIAAGLGYIGVICVEMFVTSERQIDGGMVEKIFVNEIAPRVHNSGHWTIDGAVASQFEQHVRAICGWPLGSPRRHGRIEMRNLIGEDVNRWRDFLGDGAVSLHLYGKHEARPGRKMGHMTRVFAENE
ncbi:MAG: 5-(carboxyamino)imidazole ribonucleotide synthase [Alphaproteobacteria bacterium]|nr:5-(carboxyamino)imidazole ribonucleotide synthase [Alphaproteobacteria bacterium]